MKWTVMVSMLMTALIGLLAMTTERGKAPEERQQVFKVLDHLHEYAAKADGAKYFELFGPHAVFLGTDATERWTIEEFKAYAMKRFETGTGWTYTLVPGQRFVTFAGDVAWLDELLENAKYGTCRGTGVLRKINGEWKIEQYNLTFTVPNEAAEAVVKVIRDSRADRDR